MVGVSVTISSLAPQATRRKSSRLTSFAVSGFGARIHTVFVPYILLRPAESYALIDHALGAGHSEHTVMLCVELEHRRNS